MARVRISAACARQPFRPCDPVFIANVCHAGCGCRGSSSAPAKLHGGICVTVHPTEERRLISLGAVVVDGHLAPDARGCCQFNTDDGLCGIHDKGQPFGCGASPFTLNAKDTLIVRNRYRLLKCYKADGALPAYLAHRRSLELIFGPAECARIVRHLENGGGDLYADMPQNSYRMLKDNAEMKKSKGVPEPTLYGTDLFGRPAVKTLAKGALGREFCAAPFSVLNARDGAWQTRKRAWLALGIKSELGRKGSSHKGQTNDLRGGLTYRITNGAYAAEKKKKRKPGGGLGFIDDAGEPESETAGTSVFDPVLCELAYRWFCPPGGQVVDPFAGGSVRGVVAASLGFRYWGCDLSKPQVLANREQVVPILGGGVPGPQWVVGDARKKLTEAPPADFVFSCPPYGNLEKYSNDPADISNKEYPDFLGSYRDIVARAAAALKNDRFAAFVVANFRGRGGCYHDLVGDTVRAFRKAGMGFYNEAILVTAVGSLAVRTRVQFDGSRKLGKGHQQMLVFVKGDPKKATAAIKRG